MDVFLLWVLCVVR